MLSAKEEAIKVISKLSNESSWDDIMYEIYVRQKIEQGLKDSENGKVISHEEVKNRFLK